MGLLDSYFDPQQFAASGGLLGRLLSLQHQQGLYQPGAELDETSPAPQAPVLQPTPWPNSAGYNRLFARDQTQLPPECPYGQ